MLKRTRQSGFYGTPTLGCQVPTFDISFTAKKRDKTTGKQSRCEAESKRRRRLALSVSLARCLFISKRRNGQSTRKHRSPTVSDSRNTAAESMKLLKENYFDTYSFQLTPPKNEHLLS
eukprot:GHVO01071142.1.p1 GENE.GHVO01071142.1~~GHVO01071142.1.p1  ORF type:complete len:118 (-),score=5.31 GHVO01071142.1:100-453(-)